jgi:hypothetical protein
MSFGKIVAKHNFSSGVSTIHIHFKMRHQKKKKAKTTMEKIIFCVKKIQSFLQSKLKDGKYGPERDLIQFCHP